MPRVRRNTVDIRAEILDLAQQGVTRCDIFFKLHIPYNYHHKHLSFLNDLGLAKIEKVGERELYIITQRGQKWLKVYRQLKEIENQAV